MGLPSCKAKFRRSLLPSLCGDDINDVTLSTTKENIHAHPETVMPQVEAGVVWERLEPECRVCETWIQSPTLQVSSLSLTLPISEMGRPMASASGVGRELNYMMCLKSCVHRQHSIETIIIFSQCGYSRCFSPALNMDFLLIILFMPQQASFLGCLAHSHWVFIMYAYNFTSDIL